MTLEEELKSKLTSLRKENKQLKEDLDKSDWYLQRLRGLYE